MFVYISFVVIGVVIDIWFTVHDTTKQSHFYYVNSVVVVNLSEGLIQILRCQ